MGGELDRQYFSVRLDVLPADVKMGFEIYLLINQKPVLFRSVGDSISSQRMSRLRGHSVEKVFVPRTQRELFLQTFQVAIRENAGLPPSRKTQMIGECGIHCMDSLFHGELPAAIEASERYLEDVYGWVLSKASLRNQMLGLWDHSNGSYLHCLRVSLLSMLLAEKAFGSDKEIVLAAGLAALLHDVGEREIDGSICERQFELNENEELELRRHTSLGVGLLRKGGGVPEAVIRAVHEHHEMYDGGGYPQGLRGKEIHAVSRVISIVDVYDKLVFDERQKNSWEPLEALKAMRSMQPGCFDPGFLRAFEDLVREQALYARRS